MFDQYRDRFAQALMRRRMQGAGGQRPPMGGMPSPQANAQAGFRGAMPSPQAAAQDGFRGAMPSPQAAAQGRFSGAMGGQTPPYNPEDDERSRMPQMRGMYR